MCATSGDLPTSASPIKNVFSFTEQTLATHANGTSVGFLLNELSCEIRGYPAFEMAHELTVDLDPDE
jgi:hypothetical protein